MILSTDSSLVLCGVKRIFSAVRDQIIALLPGNLWSVLICTYSTIMIAGNIARTEAHIEWQNSR